ncbi:MAG: M20/M25/M40 family metallo-hydrolase [Novosphingobium sp.]|uniref:M20/M25/M40 family metallo-hydrolase n=1 Tax=Novosphingobium sp. TaxID=1874826 RepID=UPI001DA4393E|nr:M20/M25/M40 family metallo-hydrolase [Novosphingobium sp.]MCB2058105.1 M20/M25/M40 family metallo-hydrolase [Novosphingobium sp.]MCP5387400.1 M20/M25/M40 family metallo-hydrolase [Novosphingobium sp.]
MRAFAVTALAASLMASPISAQAQALRTDQTEFRGLFKELVETNTTLSSGSCTLAAERMAARLKAAGLSDDQLTLYSTSDHPREGGLVAVWPGTSRTLRPILLIAHVDVVEAKREDWTRDPFTLFEEDGFFYARGTADDKAMAAVWVDTLIRFAKSGYHPRRTVKLALSCGEETNGAFNGIEWLAANRRELIDAEFALNEGGGGDSDGHDKVLSQQVQIGEKTFANFELEARNPGGHSSIPVRENAIYDLSRALVKIQDHEFPLEMTDVTRAYFAKAGAARHDALGDAMVALAANPQDKAAEAAVNADRGLHSNLRTTCVATTVTAGHARNALPQRATANVNCRIFPGHSIESIRDELAQVIADPSIGIAVLPPRRPSPPAPPLDPKVIAPMEKLVTRYFPGAPLIPAMSNGYTDATFLGAVGIPTYGVPGMWGSPDGDGVHGLNERISAKSLYTGRDFLFDLVKELAGK